jgi:hypothetical protein
MKIAGWFCIPALLLVLLRPSLGLPADKEKVEEGRYGILKHDGLVAGSEHSWILWRLPDGQFELEDHLPVDKAAQALFKTMLSPRIQTTPELRRTMQDAVEPSDLSAILDSSGRVLSLSVSGVKLDNHKAVGLKCKTSSSAIECTGTSDKAKLPVGEPRTLFWRYDIPLLLRPWLASPQVGSSGAGPQKIALLSFGALPKLDNLALEKKAEPGPRSQWGDKPELEAADLAVSNLGVDDLVLGARHFTTRKYKLEITVTKGNPLSLNVWTDARGLIMAVEDASNPGDLIALLAYKNYSNTPAAAPH